MAKLQNEAKQDAKPNAEMSVKWFSKALMLDGEYGLAHFRASRAYVLSGNIPQGEYHLSKALELYQKDPKAFPKEYQAHIYTLINDSGRSLNVRNH